jgi:hypothetical protein
MLRGALGAPRSTVWEPLLYAKPRIHRMCRARPDPEDMPTTQKETAEPETADKEPAVTFAAYTLHELS